MLGRPFVLAAPAMERPLPTRVRLLGSEQLLNKRELAALLRVNAWTVRRWRQRDPAFPAPSWLGPQSPRWRRRDIDAWLNSRPVGTSPEWSRRQLKSQLPKKRKHQNAKQ